MSFKEEVLRYLNSITENHLSELETELEDIIDEYTELLGAKQLWKNDKWQWFDVDINKCTENLTAVMSLGIVVKKINELRQDIDRLKIHIT